MGSGYPGTFPDVAECSAGTAVGAIAIAAFSKTSSFIKKAAAVAVLAAGVYFGASLLSSRFANAATGIGTEALSNGTAALDIDSGLNLRNLFRTASDHIGTIGTNLRSNFW